MLCSLSRFHNFKSSIRNYKHNYCFWRSDLVSHGRDTLRIDLTPCLQRLPSESWKTLPSNQAWHLKDGMAHSLRRGWSLASPAECHQLKVLQMSALEPGCQKGFHLVLCSGSFCLGTPVPRPTASPPFPKRPSCLCQHTYDSQMRQQEISPHAA